LIVTKPYWCLCPISFNCPVLAIKKGFLEKDQQDG
jgi:hypothetical protein